MSDKLKSILFLALIIMSLAFAVAVLDFVSSYSRSVVFTRSFTASGEGKVITVPDVAETTFSVLTQGGKDVVKLQQENSRNTNKAVDFLKSKEIDVKDIETSGYNISPRYQYFDCKDGICPPSEIIGYTISNSITVKIRNFDIIGDVLTGVVANGANTVSGVSFTIDDPESFKKEARNEAIKEAREKAVAIARAGGFKIGKIISISESGPYMPYYSTKAMGLASAGMEAADAPMIEPGSQELKVNVTITFEIR